jgi:8-oxo-dGTP pyrophosphatase MutT (NUDIX family)
MSQYKFNPSNKRLRATVIVEIAGNVLLTVNRKKLVMLPGGGVDRNELPIAAAARELYEETDLMATSLTELFRYESHTNFHWVFFAKAKGSPIAKSDAESLVFLNGSARTSSYNLSPATREILVKFDSIREPGCGRPSNPMLPIESTIKGA